MNTHEMDERFMRRALELATLGAGHVSPNPMVGCVIVHDNKIIGEGWHRQYGQAHAEVNAVDAVKDKSVLEASTAYVTLEPCSHFGKTPPCADMLIANGIQRVVISNVDSNPMVAGKGIDKLKAAGISITTGICEREGREVNRRFFTMIEKQRPYIILKWAQTADGFIAREDFNSKWISNEWSRKLVHKWRTEEDAVMVGTNTALHDNPQLTARDWPGRNPLRIVVDRNLRLPSGLSLFDKSTPTICYNLLKNEENDSLAFVKLNDENFIPDMITDLHIRKVQSVIIEGGSALLSEIVRLNFWDEARVFESPKAFEKGIAAPTLNGKVISNVVVEDDRLTIYRREV